MTSNIYQQYYTGTDLVKKYYILSGGQVMLLDDFGINQIVTDMQNKNLNIEKLLFKYNPDKKYVLVDGDGIPGVIQECDFYENFKDNLIYTDLSWLAPLCSAFNCNLEAKVSVDPDGSFQHDRVEMVANLQVPKKVGDNLLGFLYPRFKNFVKFYPFIKSVEVRGYQSKVCNIFFNLEIDTQKVNKILRAKDNINHQLIEQWLYMIDKCERDNVMSDRYSNTFLVLNGKINYESKTELISHYFILNKAKKREA